MGQFRVAARLTGPTGLSEQTELLVDTGATLVVLPRSLADRLEVEARRLQPVIIAGGGGAPWSGAEVPVIIDAQGGTTPCFIAPDRPALLGAGAVERLLLAVGPVA